jgi:hypothetical protein
MYPKMVVTGHPAAAAWRKVERRSRSADDKCIIDTFAGTVNPGVARIKKPLLTITQQLVLVNARMQINYSSIYTFLILG